MSTQTVLTNARIVTPNGIVTGTLAFETGRISEISARNYTSGDDLDGALVMPGIIDVHSDYLEKEINPRPGADVPLDAAMHAMDLRALTCGITTLLSAARVSAAPTGNAGSWDGDGVGLARAMERLAPGLRARHRAHIRWDTRFQTIGEDIAGLLEINTIGNVVFNDSLPGERQYREMDALIRKQALTLNVSIATSRDLMQEKIGAALGVDNRAATAAALAGRYPLGSHDDTTEEHVLEGYAVGARLCEMPVTLDAARKAKQLGMLVCMGAPNYVRGGSHCGNLSATDALAENLVDMFCSDYHLPSLLSSAVRMMASGIGPARVADLLSLNPARHLGLDDELGSIVVGKAADLVAFQPRNGYADVLRTWVGGRQQLGVSAQSTLP